MGVVTVKKHEKGGVVPTKAEEKQYDENIQVESLSTDSESQVDSLVSNPFKDPAVAEYYTALYERVQYESRSAFDPEFEWEPEEERKLLRKLDWRVALSACIMFIGLQIDRGNLAQAVVDDLLPDLGMNTNDYNTGNTIFLVAFLLAELPSQLISKKLGPDIFIPIQMISWSVVAACQGAMQNKTGFFICRALIGALEGGFIADLVLWLTYFYKSTELPLRLSWFWTSLSLCQIVTSLLAFAILRMRGVAGMAGWRWLFIIEGLITLIIGISAFYLMVPSAVQTKNKLHPKGWFNDREVKIVVNRVLRDDPSKGDMHNRQGLSVKMIAKAAWDYDLWPIYAIGFLAYIPQGTIQPYMTLSMKELGFDRIIVNLLTIPQAVLHIIFLIAVTWFSERINERALTCLSLPILTIPFMGAIRWWPGSGNDNPWVTWFLVSMVLAAPYIHAICVAWVSRNSNSIRSRSVCSALYNMTVQIGNIGAYNIYREDDKPKYYRGNTQLFILSVVMIPLLLGVKLYYVQMNKYRDRKWNEMTVEEQEDYVRTTTDEGNKRLDFRFDH
ncbi:hypothetical protein FT663_01596 [Candidozyma haemuli var. vulneris]|uniref:Major facilitator superfamily (MFS) profile domain-containing protein n=1 Tax=Candidozyma haemuli TaxID=45357 RepID=A0A2V1B1S9_9ASCO|nr:hypothetical protein CXQ85_004097 [[Candida] haemuloni]KAF3994096.1 hypothetical protein FT663_01596 [[Candida] haemuloni var. vulneris]KAF3994262.1 hypothetical protein FT662_00131 [[Candida] haemuloni var. vulneris]PVH23803.1 hypothetical protein CXQ85_004097 [[Candida] haemuloni]